MDSPRSYRLCTAWEFGMDFTNDPVTSSPGANDNASSVAAVLELLALGKGPRIERIFAWCFL